MLFGLAGRRECCKSTTMKTTECTDNYMLATTTEFSRELDARLIGLGTRVAKENVPSIFCAKLFTDKFVDHDCSLRCNRIRKKVADMQQRIGLMCNRCGYYRVTMTQRSNGDAAQEI